MKSHFLASILILSLSAHVQGNPFTTEEPSWTNSVSTAKPLSLEVGVGEIIDSGKQPIEFADPTDPKLAETILTPEFLANATRLQVAVAPQDQGRVTIPDHLTLTYKLSPSDDGYQLSVATDLQRGGRRQTNTILTVRADTWVILGGVTREEIVNDVATKKNLLIAIRISTAQGH